MDKRQRLKHLRKDLLCFTMEKFGANVGVGKTAISKIENGEREMTEQMITSICNATWNGRRVSEAWLRDGDGDPFLPEPEDAVEKFAQEHNLPDGAEIILKQLLAMPDEFRQRASEYIIKTCQEVVDKYGEAANQMEEDSEKEDIEAKVEAYRKSLIEEREAKEKSEVS